VALFYYSGHGVQVSESNYLIPIGKNFANAKEVKYHAVNAHWILEEMEDTETAVNIVILDSCRQQMPSESKGFSSKGFGQMGAKGAIISYATALGELAFGNKSRRNSIYTEHLLKAMENGGNLPIEQVFKQARAGVAADTNDDQIPWTGNGLIGDFCFGECGSISTTRDNDNKINIVHPPEPRGKYFQDRLKDGSLAPKMVKIPTGRFRMGDIQGGGDSDEKPVHSVEVKAFAMGQYEVTVGEFRKFLESMNYRTDAEKGDGCYVYDSGSWGRKSDANWRNPYYSQSNTHPVACVSWNDAVAYTEWLSAQTGQNYRLPNEAEWEYGARAGSETKYWWGNEIGRNKANCDGCGSQWDDKMTAPVGSFSANEFGLYDTVGNVWEWVADGWHDNYNGAPSDGRVWENNSNEYRVLRGGSWNDRPLNTRSANRNNNSQDASNYLIGFRVARTLAP